MSSFNNNLIWFCIVLSLYCMNVQLIELIYLLWNFRAQKEKTPVSRRTDPPTPESETASPTIVTSAKSTKMPTNLDLFLRHPQHLPRTIPNSSNLCSKTSQSEPTQSKRNKRNKPKQPTTKQSEELPNQSVNSRSRVLPTISTLSF